MKILSISIFVFQLFPLVFIALLPFSDRLYYLKLLSGRISFISNVILFLRTSLQVFRNEALLWTSLRSSRQSGFSLLLISQPCAFRFVFFYPSPSLA